MTGTKVNNQSQTRIVFRHYVTYNKGELEYAKPKCGELWMCDLGENNGSI